LRVDMLVALLETVKSDARLTALFARAAEYAEIYLLAKKRQKGCDGMGEMASLKDEFKTAVDDLMGYCKDKKYLPHDATYDIDVIAVEIGGIGKQQKE
jgi:hypothetical protein